MLTVLKDEVCNHRLKGDVFMVEYRLTEAEEKFENSKYEYYIFLCNIICHIHQIFTQKDSKDLLI